MFGDRAAPDGSPVHQNFANWFGQSQVVSSDGSPLVLYHGTPVGEQRGHTIGDITAFDRLFTQKIFGRAVSIDQVGSWFSDNPGLNGAGMYTPQDPKGCGVMYPVYLSIENPWEVSFAGLKRQLNKHSGAPMDDWNDARPNERGIDGVRAWLREIGSDGIKIMHDPYSLNGSTEFLNQTAWIALEPNQVKSAVGNCGLFDPESPSLDDAHAYPLAQNRFLPERARG